MRPLRWMKGMVSGMALGALWLCLCGVSLSVSRQVEAGNAALAGGDADAALERYQAAMAQRPDDATLHYNLGTAELAAGNAAAARDLLEEAARAPEDSAGPVGVVAPFNLGNSWMALAETQAQQPDQAKAALAEAVRAYRKAVAAAPDDVDARRNLQLAAMKLKDLEQDAQQQNSEGEQSDSQDDGQEGDEQDQSSQSKQGPSNDSENSQDAQDSQDAKDSGDQGEDSQDHPDQRDGGQDDAEQDGQSQSAQPQPDKDKTGEDGESAMAGLSQQDVANLLESLSQGEANTMREAMKRAMGPRVRVDKDW